MAPTFGLKKRKNTKKKVLIISGISATILLIAAFLLTLIYTGNKPICDEMKLGIGILGCKADEDYVYDRIAIVVGNTKNTPAPSLTEEVEKYIRNSIYAHKTKINIYSVASDFSVLSEDPGSEYESEELKDVINDKISEIESAIKSAPTANGAQYLDAIIEAATDMSSRKAKVLVVVIGSGLSDGGLLNFTQGDLLNSDPKNVVNEMRKAGDIVSGRLEDIDIYWSGLGKVKAPQSELTESEKRNLKNLYQSVLTRLGAEIIELSGPAGHGDPVKTDYYVTPVQTKKYACLWCEKKTFDSDVMGFAEDANTIDEQKALKQLSGLIDEMKNNKNESVTINGYVSLMIHDCSISESRNINHKLAQERADEVKRILVKYGVPSNRITAVGKGKGPYAECANGRYNPAEAKKNMIITIKAEA